MRAGLRYVERKTAAFAVAVVRLAVALVVLFCGGGVMLLCGVRYIHAHHAVSLSLYSLRAHAATCF